MNPMISIIIPCYHVDEDLFRTCLKSIRDQTYHNWVVILAIDDYQPGSMEEQIADEIIPFRYHRSMSREKTSPAAARNRALDISWSPFTAFLDADDWWTPDHLELLITRALSTEGDVFYTYSWRGREDVIGGREATPFLLSYANPVPWSTSMFRTETLKKYRFDESLRAGDDSDLIYRMRKEKFVFVPEITCWQTFHEGRLSNKGRYTQGLAVKWKHKNILGICAFLYYIVKMAAKGRLDYL